MPAVVKVPMQLTEENFQQGFEKMRSIEYEEDLYRVGPLFYRLSTEDSKQETRKVDFYMPISEVPQKFPYEVLSSLEIKDTILLRQADLEPTLEDARNKAAEYAEENYQKQLGPEMYCVCIDLYDEIFIDVYIPTV